MDRHRVKATFFATHETDLNAEIVARGHELGIHPNFLPGSSHGAAPAEVVETCLRFAPNARYMRTHRLIQSSPLLSAVFTRFGQLETVVSLFMRRAERVLRCAFEFGEARFERILYDWEDDAEFARGRFGDEDDHFFGDRTIFDFHPIHIHLNSRTGAEYGRLKERLGGRALQRASATEVSSLAFDGDGARTFLEAVLESDNRAISLDDVP